MPGTLPVPESQATTTSTDTTTTTIDASADATTTPTDTTTSGQTTGTDDPAATESPFKDLAAKLKAKFPQVETVREDGLPRPYHLSRVAQFHQPMPKRFEVSIEAHPSLVIDALDEDEAWEKYKTRWGIISTDKRPVINYLESENGQSDNAGSSPAG